jgi:hypothetical protein
MDERVVFIHTNDQQLLGALVGAYSLRRNSACAERFDVRLLRLEETPHLWSRQGQLYRRKGVSARWHNEDLQSFSPLRRLVPQAMGYKGRALVLDPDVFAVGDVYELLDADMEGKAILCRHVPGGYKGSGNPFYASSVMLLDCQRLTHWRWDDEIDALFSEQLDYGPWIALASEPPDSIGELKECWNSFDELADRTKLLHMTERSTQPWKTGLPVDYDLNVARARPKRLLARAAARLGIGASTEDRGAARYLPHPDPRQEQLFFSLLRECLEAGEVTDSFLQRAIRAKHLRPDAFEFLEGIGYRPDPAGRPRPGSLLDSLGLDRVRSDEVDR